MRFFSSLRCACKGLIYVLTLERNMRIHGTVAFYVLLLSPFFALSSLQYAVLFCIIALVFAAEAVNTAIEKLCDEVDGKYNKTIRLVKDIAAGAVLACAIGSVAVGVCLFWNGDAFVRMYHFFLHAPWWFVLLLLSIPVAVCYVVLGPRGIRNKLQKRCR